MFSVHGQNESNRRFDTMSELEEPVGNGNNDKCFISKAYDATRYVVARYCSGSTATVDNNRTSTFTLLFLTRFIVLCCAVLFLFFSCYCCCYHEIKARGSLGKALLSYNSILSLWNKYDASGTGVSCFAYCKSY